MALCSTYKTAGYSFINPLLSGTTMAGADTATKETLIEYGVELGIAYQLRDNLLDVFGDKNKTGKLIACDLREAKQTLLVKTFLQKSNQNQKNKFNLVFGNPSTTEAEVEAARLAIRQSGAERLIQDQVCLRSNNARKALLTLKDSGAKHELLNLVDRLIEREK